MKAYQDRGMRITMLNRTTKNTATVANGTTKTQHSHTQQQHETRGGRRTHTVRYMEAKTVIFSATCENWGTPSPQVFSVARKGYPTPRGGERLGRWGTPSRRDFQSCENGVAHPHEKCSNVFFLCLCIATRLSCYIYNFIGHAVTSSVKFSRHSVVHPRHSVVGTWSGLRGMQRLARACLVIPTTYPTALAFIAHYERKRKQKPCVPFLHLDDSSRRDSQPERSCGLAHSWSIYQSIPASTTAFSFRSLDIRSHFA